MSFEGFFEFLCVNGHYTGCDVYDSEPKECPTCGERLAYRNMVDQTNGELEDCPDTMPGLKEEIGADDVRHMDHKGNEYFTRAMRYRPVGDWRKLA